jgi:hypothetical protein
VEQALHSIRVEVLVGIPVGVGKKMGEKEHEGGKEDRDVETKEVAFNPESSDFLGMLHRVHSYSRFSSLIGGRVGVEYVLLLTFVI